MNGPIAIREASQGDIDAVVKLDEFSSGMAKPDYWDDVFDRYLGPERPNRFLFVAEQDGAVIGFIVGEIRAWEFGSPPCGWVFALGVQPDLREHGVGRQLMDTICDRFKSAGADTVRTMVSKNNTLELAFFRSHGLTAGSYIQLEMKLD